MLSFLGGLISGLLGLLNSVLPNSPFSSWIQATENLQTGLAWLNWVVPVGDMIGIFLAYLALLLAWIGIRYVLGKAEGILGKLAG